MNCIYQYLYVSKGNEGRAYFERMNERGDVVPFFYDSIAHVTITDDGHYAISNVENEVFFIGTKGLQSVDKLLKQFENINVFINGLPRTND